MTPPISFDTIPAQTRVPFVHVEFDATRAALGQSIQPYRLLLIGQRTSAGTVAELELTRVFSADQGRGYFGEGSVLAHMIEFAFLQTAELEVWAVALDDVAGTAATETITVSGTATVSGTIALYVGGRRVTVSVVAGDDSDTVAASIDAAVNAADNLPMTSGVASSVVTLTARNSGTLGNFVDVRHSYYEDEELPTGISLAIAAGATGATDPDLDSVWPLLAEQFNVIVSPYSATADLAKLTAELGVMVSSVENRQGVAIVGVRDTLANLVTKGDGQNSRFLSLLGADNSPTSPWEWASAAAAVVARRAKADPARPFQRQVLVDVLPPPTVDVFTHSEQEALLADGIATYAVTREGLVQIQRMITTYQTAAGGAPDTAFLDLNTPLTLDFLRWDLSTRIVTAYPDAKLAGDAGQYGAGQVVVTPNGLKAFIVGVFRDWMERGLVEAPDQFADDLIVEISATDPNRVDIAMSPDLVNQFRVAAVKIQFLL